MLSHVATLIVVLSCAITNSSDEPERLTELRQRFHALQHPTEADRVRYITALVRLRETFTRADSDKMGAIDAEVINYPIPEDVDSAALRKRIVGHWSSPRHQYLYRADGTWTILPEFIEGVKSTAGTWSIEGNRFIQNFKNSPGSHEEIILLTATDFVWSTRVAPYYMRRGDVHPWR